MKDGEVVGGSNVDIMNLLSSKYGFSITFNVEKSFGQLNKTTGIWNGMVGNVRFFLEYAPEFGHY